MHIENKTYNAFSDTEDDRVIYRVSIGLMVSTSVNSISDELPSSITVCFYREMFRAFLNRYMGGTVATASNGLLLLGLDQVAEKSSC